MPESNNYRFHSPHQSDLFRQASEVIPGGVNSPVRAFGSVGGNPIFFKKAQGAVLTDEDGKTYVDYINSWGPMILGHSFEPVVEAVIRQLRVATSFGAPTVLETKMAMLITEMVPGVEQVRMVNSGTEACMSAIRLARGYTGKEKLIKFTGNYHGHGDPFLIQAGSGALTLGVPNSPGVTKGTAANTLLANYNDLDSVTRLVEANKGEIAALIVEPVAGNMGCIPPVDGFLEGLRSLCTDEGIVLIFDEVMTGFRLAPGGAQERFGVTADLVTMGKIIGGGMPVGAFGGSKEIMGAIAPSGPVYQAGTLSGNPIAMTSGFTTLSYLKDHPDIYQQLEEKGKYLAKGLGEILAAVPHRINQIGAMISLHFTMTPVVDFASAQTGDHEYFRKFYHHMLSHGVYLPPSPYESWFFSVQLSQAHMDQTLEAVQAWVKES